MHKAFTRLARAIRFQNPYWTYICDRYIRPDLQEADYHFVRSSDSVLIIPQIDEQHVVVVKQYRYLQQKWGWEFPGGGQLPDQPALISATQELQEETGYTAREWSALGSFSPCVGLIDETCEVFVAKGLTAGPTQTEPAEEIECHILSFTEIDHAIQTGTMWSGMSQAAWMLFTLHHSSHATSPQTRFA